MTITTPQPNTTKDDGVLTDLLHRLSHDLRAPLRGMVEMATILSADYNAVLDGQGRECLSILAACGEKAQLMVSGLLDYVRIARDPTPFAPVDCNPLVSTCLAKLKGKIGETQARCGVASLPTVLGNAAQIKIVFAALVDNALKFRRPNLAPAIEISAEKNGLFWNFCVADNGIGVGARDSERIFELFQRLHGDEDYPGAGAGLSLARQVVDRHGGRIWHSAHRPQGSAFHFTLPDFEAAP